MDFDWDTRAHNPASADSDDDFSYQMYKRAFNSVSDDSADADLPQIISANTFDISDIMPHTCISIIGRTSTRSQALLKNIIHILNVKYDIEFILVSICAENVTLSNHSYPHYSMEELIMNKSLVTSKTVLIFDNRAYDDDYMNSFSDFLSTLNGNFHNIVVCYMEKCIKENLCIPYDIYSIFPQYVGQQQKIYDRFIDKEFCSFDTFDSVFRHAKEGFSLVVQDGRLSVCQAENTDTYYTYYFECDLFYDRNISLLNRIKDGYSMFHKYDSPISQSLQFNITYNKKCCYILMSRDLITPRLPNELYIIICELMILLYLDVYCYKKID